MRRSLAIVAAMALLGALAFGVWWAVYHFRPSPPPEEAQARPQRVALVDELLSLAPGQFAAYPLELKREATVALKAQVLESASPEEALDVFLFDEGMFKRYQELVKAHQTEAKPSNRAAFLYLPPLTRFGVRAFSEEARLPAGRYTLVLDRTDLGLTPASPAPADASSGGTVGGVEPMRLWLKLEALFEPEIRSGSESGSEPQRREGN